mmetsp:Transcript_8039/g.23650  ORF Transcript_8039/g.23650 Transcript_8039/m.23650 type:complete len:233 (+) Transcript_8039:629-1327(+)
MPVRRSAVASRQVNAAARRLAMAVAVASRLRTCCPRAPSALGAGGGVWPARSWRHVCLPRGVKGGGCAHPAAGRAPPKLKLPLPSHWPLGAFERPDQDQGPDWADALAAPRGGGEAVRIASATSSTSHASRRASLSLSTASSASEAWASAAAAPPGPASSAAHSCASRAVMPPKRGGRRAGRRWSCASTSPGQYVATDLSRARCWQRGTTGRLATRPGATTASRLERSPGRL